MNVCVCMILFIQEMKNRECNEVVKTRNLWKSNGLFIQEMKNRQANDLSKSGRYKTEDTTRLKYIHWFTKHLDMSVTTDGWRHRQKSWYTTTETFFTRKSSTDNKGYCQIHRIWLCMWRCLGSLEREDNGISDWHGIGVWETLLYWRQVFFPCTCLWILVQSQWVCYSTCETQHVGLVVEYTSVTSLWRHTKRRTPVSVDGRSVDWCVHWVRYVSRRRCASRYLE